MRKNTGAQTATTFKFRTSVMARLPETHALFKPFNWGSDIAGARKAVETLTAGDATYTHHTAPGLEVWAFYLRGERYIVIVIEDATAARLHTAVRREQPVTVTYTKADGTETVRTIEPTSLAITKAGDVIVKAMDRESGAARTFRLDRISAYTVHRTRRTVRTETPAPTKAELWQQWTDTVEGQTWDGRTKRMSGEAYRELLAARDPREPRAADEALSYA
jgi:predicted DNA-binding transcriptional regulator YafY